MGGFPAFAPELAADEGFRDSFFHQLAGLESQNFWFQARSKLIDWALRRYFPSTEKFLEIGCGTGFVLSGLAASFPCMRLSGSEISSVGLAHAAARVPTAELFQMDARAIPFQHEFDVIGAFDVLEHIEEDEQVLRQIYTAAKPGGGIILTVPQHAFLWSQQDEAACHVRRYSRGPLIEKVVRAGFNVEVATSFVSLLLPLMMWSRRRKRVPSDRFDPMAELKLGRIANTTLAGVMSVECSLIEWGARFPAGGSLLLVARKN